MNIFLLILSILMIAGGLSAIVYSLMIHRKMKFEKKKEKKDPFHTDKNILDL